MKNNQEVKSKSRGWGGLFIGFGIGFLVNNIPAGMFIGLGAGFAAFAISIAVKCKCK